MSKDISARNTNKGLLPTEHSSIQLDTLDNPMYSLEMFPDESTNTGITGKRLVGSIRKLIARLWTFNWNIISKGLSPVRNLGTQDMSDVTLENRQES